MENPLLSARAEAFPAGLRVLVVDDDPTWLKILEKMLRKCSYEVTTCCLAADALDMLRERKDKFDIVISDVNMPDMDGFKLLEQVGLEMDLPVIMMSIDGEISRVMKGVQHGACDYLLKPVRMKELRNIWQHVYRKKMHEVKEIEVHSFSEDIDILRNGLEDLQDRKLMDGAEMTSARKRKDVDYKDSGDQEFDDPCKLKKARVVWSVDLHKKFVDAVNQIGFDKVGPKKILDLMNVPGLTRENVASHLQKYRLYLSRLQKEGEGSSCGNAPGDLVSTDNKGNFASIPKESVFPRNVGTTENFTPGIISDVHVGEIKKTVPVQVAETSKAPASEIPSTAKANSSIPSQGVYLSFRSKTSNVNEKACEPITRKEEQPLYDGAPMLQFMQYPKQACLTSSTHQASLDLPSSSLDSVISSEFNNKKDWRDQHEMRTALADPKDGYFAAAAAPPVACMIDSVPLQVKHGTVRSQDIEAVCKQDGSPSKKECYFDQTGNQCELSLTGETQPHSLLDDLSLCAIQKISCLENLDLGGAGIFQYIDPTTAARIQQSNWIWDSELGGEYFYETVDFPSLDECLFAW